MGLQAALRVSDKKGAESAGVGAVLQTQPAAGPVMKSNSPSASQTKLLSSGEVGLAVLP